ncbi:CpaD family pilus assembly protein [Dongia rigui]|uniref:CpaD family pilus assembly lipoprotein n=1 Tax=Dongia rigui TaxID=940149 RepID=A0ABU5DUZ6_9PROT|nr:CpaD family pilus assembly lipoprotein [Dongia rigui]MDY0870770.1 CpaD family pilus assembly lipoprotein [Dongia rigui]
MKRRLLATAMFAVLGALGLAGCEANMPDYEYGEQHPIKVETRTALLILDPGPGGRVQNADLPAITEFSSDFGKKAAGGITVRVGAANAADPLAQAFATDVMQVLASRGIPAAAVQLSFATDPQSAKYGRAVMEYPIYVALADECGTWKDRPEFTPLNENTYNFGCATQRNIAAMIVNPKDLEDAALLSGRLAARADNIVGKYIVGAKIGGSTETPAILPPTTTGGN